MPDTALTRAELMLVEAREDVRQADQKASVLLAALGIGFGAVLGGQLSAGWNSTSLSALGQILWWVGVSAAVLSVVCSALAVWPRYKLDDSPEFGPTYWGHAAAFEDRAKLQAALERKQADSMMRATDQLWRISRVVTVKYRFVRAALIFGGASGAMLGVGAVIIR